MLVAFNPMINTGADANASYMNFLRCVTAIATAPAGTSSLTVNPFTNNTGTIDTTRNCIVSIIANTEAGGWTTSASHNVVNTGAFTAIASAAGGLFKADFFNSSGKGTLPFNKLSFHTMPLTSTSDGWSSGGWAPNVSNFASYPLVCMTYGCHTVSDWSTVSGYVPGGSATFANAFNTGTQTTSRTILYMGAATSTPNNSNYNARTFWTTNANVIYYMAVTANYCIIWEQHVSNSYLNGYANAFTPPNSTGGMFGTLAYAGLRETQAWENSLATNPPWVVFEIGHTQSAQANLTWPILPESLFAYMATVNNSGVTTTTATIYGYINSITTSIHYSDMRTQATTQQLLPLIGHGRDFGTAAVMGSSWANQSFMPTVDVTTGTAVPSAYPIVVRRPTSDTWNPGGAVRGIYKSLNMPITSMRNYFANGQTFNIFNAITNTTDTYLPIVFNQTMYLVRVA